MIPNLQKVLQARRSAHVMTHTAKTPSDVKRAEDTHLQLLLLARAASAGLKASNNVYEHVRHIL